MAMSLRISRKKYQRSYPRTVERLEQEKEDVRSEQQLLELQQYDQIDFLLLQINQPLAHDS
jgi:hypothetical protein